MKPAFYLLPLLLFYSCHHPGGYSGKPEKVTVNVNGSNHTVVNHPEGPNGNTFIPGVCITCLLQIIQHTQSYQSATHRMKTADLVYTVKRVSGPALAHKVEHPGGGMEVNISKNKRMGSTRLLTYYYNNTTATFYLLNTSDRYEEEPLKADSTALLRVRNSCFWGVASNK